MRAALADLADLHEPAEFARRSAALGRDGAKVLLDPKGTPAAIAAAIRDAGGTIVEGADPAELPKARKNPTELAGTRRAHIRDGAAMVRFLAWLDRAAPERRDRRDRRRGEARRVPRRHRTAATAPNWSTSPSPPSPAPGRTAPSSTTASRPRPTAGSRPGSLYLVDSGGQYRDGTTDITRTVAIGAPSG